jgi:hypothetical protein
MATPIIDFETAKTALDEEIASAQAMAEYYRREASEAKAKAEARDILVWTLKTLRERFDPPALSVVEGGKDAA